MRKIYFLSALLAGFALQAQVQMTTTASFAACQGSCYEISAAYTTINQTTGYSVSQILYAPQFPTIGGTVLDATADDIWSPVVNIPFNFNFYGTNYNTLLVGSNGAITFDTVNQQAGGFCSWAFGGTIPNVNFPIKNAIFGVYQDNNISSPPVTIPAMQNVNYYILENNGANAAPNRVFVMNLSELPQFQCNNSVGLQTSQIVLYEGTNIIEVYVKKRTSCMSWNNGAGVIGLIDGTGTLATVPPGRNIGTWSATDEAWRFTPTGAQVPTTFMWSLNGVDLGSDNPLMICPTEPGTYTATLSIENLPTIQKEVQVTMYNSPLAEPADITVCGDGPYVANLDSNTALVLNGENPSHYDVNYYESLEDAQNYTAHITTPAAYSFTINRTIYIRTEDITLSGCVSIKPFMLFANPVPAAPTGSATQLFVPGETLASLEVNGQNIQWYDSASGFNLLPLSTALQNNTTYYASQTVSDCESRMVANRLAVTAMSTLKTAQFSASDIRLYPNPANNSLTVSYPAAIDQVEVYNVLGQIVIRENETGKEIKLDVSNLHAGNYFIKITSGETSIVSKFIKK